MSKRRFGRQQYAAQEQYPSDYHGRAIKRSRNVYSRPILPIFEPSGLLALESNNEQGLALKHVEPPDAITPDSYFTKWKVARPQRTLFELFLYKKGAGDQPLKSWVLESKSAYIIGRDMGRVAEDPEEEKEVVVADIGIPEESTSKQHCVFQFRQKQGYLVPYILDLNSANGTLLNGTVLPPARYVQLQSGDVVELADKSDATEYELVFVAE
ncbi:AaceriACR039Cp [[Ashbya] aceris (nom. inval.)]|nr:AaceriACR039Cp [[Ashbya] aceris (nom. inval.)]